MSAAHKTGEHELFAGSATKSQTPRDGMGSGSDGKRVAVVTPVGSVKPPKQDHEIAMFLNFFDELRQRVPLSGK